MDYLDELKESYQSRVDKIEKTFDPTYIEKGKKAQIGEIREWSDGKYRRTATGWEYIKGSNDPKKSIQIEKINYFEELAGSDDYNGKVLYRKDGKLNLACIYIDFFNKYIHIGRNQPKECKVLGGLEKTLNDFAEKTNWKLKE